MLELLVGLEGHGTYETAREQELDPPRTRPEDAGPPFADGECDTDPTRLRTYRIPVFLLPE
jgi:hypothetical protein